MAQQDDYGFTPDNEDFGFMPDEQYFSPDKKPYVDRNSLYGLSEMPRELYNTVNKAGKAAFEHIKQGQYPAAFRDIAAPIAEPIEGLIGMGVNKIQGKPVVDLPKDIGDRRAMGLGQLAGVAGFPTEGFQEAWKNSDWDRLAGQAAGAALSMYLPHKMGELFHPTEFHPPTEVEPTPKLPPFLDPERSYTKLPSEHPMRQLDLPLEGDLRQPTLPFPQRRIESGDRAVKTFEEPYFYDYGPQQQDLPLDMPTDAGGQGTLFDMSPPSRDDAHAVQSMVMPDADIVPPVQNPPADIKVDITGPTVIPEGSSLSDNQQVVTISTPSKATVEFWRSRGYVPVQGLRSADGYPQMVRGDVAPMYTGASAQPPAQEVPQARPDVPGPLGPGQVGAGPGQDVEIPNQRADAPSFISNMEKGGFKVVNRDSKYTTFRKILGNERGADNMTMWVLDYIGKKFKKAFGREGNPEELQQFREEQVGPIPGENDAPVIPSLEEARMMDEDTASSFLEDTIKAIDYWQNRLTDFSGVGDDDGVQLAYQNKARAEQILDALNGNEHQGSDSVTFPNDPQGRNAGRLDALYPPKSEPPPPLAGVFEQAAAELDNITDPNEIRQHRDIIQDGIDVLLEHNNNPEELNAYRAMLDILNGKLDAAEPGPRLSGGPEDQTIHHVYNPDISPREIASEIFTLANESGPEALRRVNDLTDEFEVLINAETNPTKIRRNFEEIQKLWVELDKGDGVPHEGVSPDEYELIGTLRDIAFEKFRNDVQPARYPEDAPPFGQIRPMSELRQQFVSEAPFMEEGQSTRPTMDPRMAARVEQGGPREFDFTQPPPQQGNLFPMEMRPPEPSGDIAQLRAQQILGENWGETRQPEQLSMEGQMKDAEIADYLRRQQEPPPPRQRGLFGDERGVKIIGSEPPPEEMLTLPPESTPTPIEQLPPELMQQRLMHPPMFHNPTPEPYSWERQSPAAILAERKQKALDLEAAGDIEGARATRSGARFARAENISRAETLLEMAKIREARGDTEGAAKLRARADRRFLEEAGQLKLFEEQKKGIKVEGLTPEMAAEARSVTDPEEAARYLSHSYAKGILESIPAGPPGLTVDERWSYGEHKSYEIVYRDKDGKAVTVARVEIAPERENTGTSTFVSDKNRGALYGKGMLEVGKEIVKLNAAKPLGMFSKHTSDLVQRLQKMIGNEKGIARVDIPEAFGEGWERLKKAAGWGQGETGKPKSDEFNFIREALALPSAATTTGDFSAPGRQGLSQILTPQFWVASAKMFQGMTEKGFNQIDRDLMSKDIMRPRINEDGTVGKSFAQEIGLKVFRPASEVGPRAEAVASRWLETGGNIPYLSKAYRNTVGYPIRATNRMFLTFLNHLNVNRTEFLLNRARDMSMQALDTGRAPMPGMLGGVKLPEFMGGADIGFKKNYSPSEAMDLNPYHNLPMAKEIADFVNTATGHAPLRTHVLPFKGAELNLEKAAGFLNHTLFSPGLLFSRIRMLNPNTYIMATPFVRKQYMKAALSTGAAWFAFTELAKQADPEAEVNNENITSADFGKVRIGDTRMDPGGGFLQFLTAYGRLYQGGSTSSSSGQFQKFGSGYQAQTQEDMMERFFVNKLNPVVKFGYDMAAASEYNPFHVKDRTLQLFVPLVTQDIYEIAKENPDLIPWIAPVLFGMGTQTYSKGESVGKLVDPENDILYQGGAGGRALMPWNWGADENERRTYPWDTEPN